MVYLSKDYLDTVCQIHTVNNTIIGLGKITTIEDNYIIITSSQDNFLIQDFLSCVKITLQSPIEGYKVILGNVSESQTDSIRLSNLHLLTDNQRRDYFRVHVANSTKIFLCNSTDAVENQIKNQANNCEPDSENESENENKEEDETLIPYINVTIKDLSLGGTFIESDAFLQIGQEIVLEIITHKGPQYLLMTVKRRQQDEMDENSLYQYGCEFNKVSNCKSDALCRLLLEIQSHIIKKVKN